MTPQKGEQAIVHGYMDDYGTLVAITAKAYLISLPNSNTEGFWIPKSQCDFRVSDRGWEAEVPEWLADKIETSPLRQNV